MPIQVTSLPTLSESLARSKVTSGELLKPTVTYTPHVVTISDQFVLVVAVPVGVGCAAIAVVLTAIRPHNSCVVRKIHTQVHCTYYSSCFIHVLFHLNPCSIKLSKKKTATAMQSYNMVSCGESENIKNKDSFKMSGFSNPVAQVDVSYLRSFIMSFASMNINLKFVGESC